MYGQSCAVRPGIVEAKVFERDCRITTRSRFRSRSGGSCVTRPEPLARIRGLRRAVKCGSATDALGDQAHGIPVQPAARLAQTPRRLAASTRLAARSFLAASTTRVAVLD